MQHIYFCPECGCEHAEPADAYFVLGALCLNCDLDLELQAARRHADESILVAA